MLLLTLVLSLSLYKHSFMYLHVLAKTISNHEEVLWGAFYDLKMKKRNMSIPGPKPHACPIRKETICFNLFQFNVGSCSKIVRHFEKWPSDISGYFL